MRDDVGVRASAARRTAWTAAAVSAVLTTVGLTIGLGDASAVSSSLLAEMSVSVGLALTLPVLGAFILSRDSTNRLGWAFTASGVSRSLYVLATFWVKHTYVVRPGSLPFGSIATWVVVNTLLPALIVAPLTLLWAPNGQLPGRRWCWAYLAITVAGLAWLGTAAATWAYRGARLVPSVPVTDQLPSPVADALTGVTLVASLMAVAAGLASLLWRLRTPDRIVAQQVKWYLLGMVFNVGLNLFGDIATGGPSGWNLAGLLAFEAAVAVAIAHHRLWDVDRLINRTLVYGVLSAIAAGIYAATVISLGVVFAGIAHRQQIAVAGATLAAIAMTAPARGALQRVIDRRFDRRAYDAVAQVHAFADRLGSDPPDPGELCSLLGEVLGDPELDLRFSLPDGQLVDACGAPGPLPDGDHRVATQWPGRSGVTGVVLHRPTAEADARLFADVLRAASSSFEHARLQAELRVQLAAVEASRTRVVVAADAERRRVERNIHDGAQQRLVALALSLRADQRRLGPSLGPDALHVIDGTVTQLQEAVAELRALAQGLVPAALASEGLGPALLELATHQAGLVRLLEVPDHRHPPSTEATAWFVACEGLANAAKHAVGAEITLACRCHDDSLAVVVSDTGPGGAEMDRGSGLRGLADRVAASGGRLHLDSPPGSGTVLMVSLPCG